MTRVHPHGHLVTFKKMQSAMYDRRHKTFPKVPRTTEEFLTGIQSNETLCSFFKGPVRLEDGQICAFMFAQDSLLASLGESQEIGFDGTFFVVPRLFYQLFTIFVIHEHHFFPAITVLMTGKDQPKYLAVFRALINLIPNFNPTLGMADFEPASRNAAHEIWENLIVHGCFFHFTRALYKYVQSVGLSRCFMREVAFKSWIKKIMSVPLLPANEIEPAFVRLLQQHFTFEDEAENLNIAKFKRYVTRFWQRQTSAEVLSVYGMTNATNNGAESFHSWLKTEIKVHHPNCWNFVYHLNDILEDKALDFRRMGIHGPDDFVRERRKKIQRNLDHRRQAEQRLAQNEISPDQFLSLVSHTFDGQIARMQQAFRANPNLLVDDPEVPDVGLDVAADVVAVPVVNALAACTICLEARERDVAMLPCGHTNSCSSCIARIIETARNARPAPRTAVCPFCRTPITGTVTLFRQ
jgi:hypothetical protein